MKKLILIFIGVVTTNAIAQDRSITTGVPFLQIAADARAAGMGDIGVATSPDTYSQQWNPAKYAFATDAQGTSAPVAFIKSYKCLAKVSSSVK